MLELMTSWTCTFETRASALDWLERELPNLMACLARTRDVAYWVAAAGRPDVYVQRTGSCCGQPASQTRRTQSAFLSSSASNVLNGSAFPVSSASHASVT
jgi:hypothetical protein